MQGGLYPAQIWQTYMQPANQFLPIEDWSAPPPDRAGAGAPVPARQRVPLPDHRLLGRRAGQRQPPAGFAAPEQAPPTPTTRARRRPPPAQPVQTVPVRPVYAQVDAGTTIPPNNLDANAPVPSVLLSQGLSVRGC